MSQQSQSTDAQAKDTRQSKVNPPQVETQTNVIDPLSDVAPFRGGSMAAQVAMLEQLPAAQRHAMLRRVGRVQGNRYVQRLVASVQSGVRENPPSSGEELFLKPEIEVSEPGDEYEQEADTVADQVVQASAPPPEGNPGAPEDGSELDTAVAAAQVQAQPEPAEADEAAAPPAAPEFAVTPPPAETPPAGRDSLDSETAQLPTAAEPSAEESQVIEAAPEPVPGMGLMPPSGSDLPQAREEALAEGVAAVAGRIEQARAALDAEPFPVSVESAKPYSEADAGVGASGETAGDLSVVPIEVEGPVEVAQELPMVEPSASVAQAPPPAPPEPQAPFSETPISPVEVSRPQAVVEPAPDVRASPPTETPLETDKVGLPVQRLSLEAEETVQTGSIQRQPKANRCADADCRAEQVQLKLKRLAQHRVRGNGATADRVLLRQAKVNRCVGQGCLEEKAQLKVLARRRAETEAGIDQDGKVAPAVAQRVQGLQRGGEPLPESTRAGLELDLGHDFSGVRIHRDTEAAQVSQQVGARAFTVGQHIAFGAGEYAPETPGGKHLLAHELTHVVQQTGSAPLPARRRVAAQRASGPVVQRDGGGVLDDLWQKIQQIVAKARALAGQKAREIAGAAGAAGASVAAQGQVNEQSVTGQATTEAGAVDSHAESEALSVEGQAADDTSGVQAFLQTEAGAIEGQATAEMNAGQVTGQGYAQTLDEEASNEGGALEAEAQAGQAAVAGDWAGLQAESGGALADIDGQGSAAWSGVEGQAQAAGAEIEGNWMAIEGQASSEIPAAEAQAVPILRGLRDEAIDMVEGANLQSGEDLASLEGGKASIVGRAMEILGQAWGPFDPIIELLQGGWDGLKGLAGSVWERVKGAAGSAWDMVKQLGGMAWAGLQSGWERLKGFAQGLWDGLAGRASAAWEGLKTLAGNAWQGLKGMVGAALSALRDRAAAAWQGLQGLAGTALANLRTKATAAWTGLRAMATNAWNGLRGLGQSLWSALSGKGEAEKGGVEGKKSSAISSVKGVAGGFLSHIGSILGGLRGRAGDALNRLRGRVQGALNALRQRGQQALATLRARAEAAQQMLQQWSDLSIANLGATARGALVSLLGRSSAAESGLEIHSMSLLDWLRGVGETAVRGLQGLWQGLKGRIGGFWDGIKAFAGSVWQRFRGGVSAIWQCLRGLWDGLKAKLAGVWQRIKAAFEALKEKVRQAWERVKQSWLGILMRALGLWARARGTGAEGWGDVTDDARALKADALQLKARAGQPVDLQHPGAILRRLGRGRQMDSSVRAKMEGAFGTSLAGVRVHTGENAARLARQVNARAFTVGNHIAFDTGEYQPGTLLGDALMAHEVAHTVQQRGAAADTLAKGYAPEESTEEMDADRAAIGAVAGNWLGLKGMLRGIPSQALPRLRTGLGLRRCCKSEIAVETKFNAPDGSPKTRTDVGIGEDVEFTAPNAGEWTASGGSPTTLASGTTFDWTAPNRAATVTIKLKVCDNESSIDMNVIEPDGITATKNSEISYPAGTQGAGMTLTFNYHPMNASFGNVESKEVSGPATNIWGYFKDNFAPADLWHDSGDTFYAIGQDNRDTATDTAAFSGLPAPWKEGGFEWEIPNHFRVIGEGGDGKEFTIVVQIFSILDTSGRSRVEKAGASVERSP